MEKNPPPAAAAAAASGGSGGGGSDSRDFLLHLESYLARRDGVDKLLKISRYAAKIALASRLPPETLTPRLRAFETSVGLSRKAFRLGKFVQDLNALRAASPPTLLAVLAYGGEGVYYFLEQIVWLSKSGLIPSTHSKLLQKLSAWAELVGYAGSIAMKVREVRRIQSVIRLIDGVSDGDRKALKEKLLLKQLSVVQDLADGMMALGDVTEGKGLLGDPLLLASAGMVSALISAQKNWAAC